MASPAPASTPTPATSATPATPATTPTPTALATTTPTTTAAAAAAAAAAASAACASSLELRGNLQLCRICVSAPTGSCAQMIPIFGEESLWQKLTYLADVKIEKGDALPQQVCIICARNAISACSFKRKCEDADSFFRQQQQQLIRKIEAKTTAIRSGCDVITLSEGELEKRDSHNLSDNADDGVNDDDADDGHHNEHLHQHQHQHQHQHDHDHVHVHVHNGAEDERLSANGCHGGHSGHSAVLEDDGEIKTTLNGKQQPFDFNSISLMYEYMQHQMIKSNGVHDDANSVASGMDAGACDDEEPLPLIPEIELITPSDDMSVALHSDGGGAIDASCNSAAGHGYQCPQCYQIFEMKQILKAHMQSVHGAAGPVYECTNCKKTYFYKRFLEKHMRRGRCVKKRRNQTRPMQCSDCNVLFPTGHHLGWHKRTGCPSRAAKMPLQQLFKQNIVQYNNFPKRIGIRKPENAIYLHNRKLIMANNKRKGRTRIKLDAKKIALAKQLILREATTTVIANELNISRTFAWRLRKSLVNGVSLHERVIDQNSEEVAVELTAATHSDGEQPEEQAHKQMYHRQFEGCHAIKTEQNAESDIEDPGNDDAVDDDADDANDNDNSHAISNGQMGPILPQNTQEQYMPHPRILHEENDHVDLDNNDVETDDEIIYSNHHQQQQQQQQQQHHQHHHHHHHQQQSQTQQHHHQQHHHQLQHQQHLHNQQRLLHNMAAARAQGERRSHEGPQELTVAKNIAANDNLLAESGNMPTAVLSQYSPPVVPVMHQLPVNLSIRPITSLQNNVEMSNTNQGKKPRKPNVFIDDEKYAIAKMLVAQNASTMEIARALNVSQMTAWKVRDAIVKGVPLSYRNKKEIRSDVAGVSDGVVESEQQHIIATEQQLLLQQQLQQQQQQLQLLQLQKQQQQQHQHQLKQQQLQQQQHQKKIASQQHLQQQQEQQQQQQPSQLQLQLQMQPTTNGTTKTSNPRRRLKAAEREKRDKEITRAILDLIKEDSNIQYWKVSARLAEQGFPISPSSVCQKLKSMGIHRRWKPGDKPPMLDMEHLKASGTSMATANSSSADESYEQQHPQRFDLGGAHFLSAFTR